MEQIRTLLKGYAGDESGATAIEYGLIAALIGIGLMSGASALAGSTDSSWSNMSDKVNDAFNTP